MGPDGANETDGAGVRLRAIASREEKRAASLRANLQRRKAQARGRADIAPQQTDEAEPPEAPAE